MTTVEAQPTDAVDKIDEQQERDIGGKYLTFKLSNETYGVQILKVREIIGMMQITMVPQTPDYVKGVINLRGKVIPVIDLRMKFAMPKAEVTDETCIIVIDVGNSVGIIVDAVQEVADVGSDEIEPPPPMGSEVDSDFILGLAKARDSVKILLDIEKTINADQWDRFATDQERQELDQVGQPAETGDR